VAAACKMHIVGTGRMRMVHGSVLVVIDRVFAIAIQQ